MIILPNVSEIFKDVVARTGYSYNELRSGYVPFYTEELNGYVHTLKNNKAVLIAENLQPYLIPDHYIDQYHLETGDRLTGKTAYSMEFDNLAVTEVKEVTKFDYETAPVVKSTRSFKIKDQDVKLGTTAAYIFPNNNHLTTYLQNIVANIPDDVEKIFLSFDGRKENYDMAKTLYITTPSQTNRDKLMTCLIAFFQAKAIACTGKNVILIVDSFDKMFTVFNNCVQQNGVIEPNSFSAAAAIDLESILCSSKCLKDRGTFTIVGLHRPDNSATQIYVNMRLHQILDTIIE